MDESGAGHGSRSKPQPVTGGAPADRISNLSDDILLQILLNLSYASDAARTNLLSRRWRGLSAQLPEVDVTLRDVPLRSLEDALRRAAHPGLRQLDIGVPVQDRPNAATTISSARRFCGTVFSVLHEATRLSPARLHFSLDPNLTSSPADPYVAVNLPSFQRATSINLRAPPCLRLTLSRASTGFPALESLSLSGCHIDLDALVTRCPRLRVLTVAAGAPGPGCADVTVRSSSLQELSVYRRSDPTSRIVVQAPMVKQLTMSFVASPKLSVSIVAPMVEKIWWRCSYAGVSFGLGLWDLMEVSLETAERHGGWWAGCSNADAGTGDDACKHLPRVNVLSLTMWSTKHSRGFPDGDIEFAAEISKHMVTHFSALELHLKTEEHEFGLLVWRLFGMHHISNATRSLRIVLRRSEVKVWWRVNCDSGGPWIRRTQTISLPNLEKLEVEGFEGEDHEVNFLALMFKRAPVLTKVTVKLPDLVSNVDWCTKLYDIFAEHPSVECNVDLISDK